MKFALFFAVFAMSQPAAHAFTLHVSPQGNDKWSGSLDKPNKTRNDGPLASLQGARDRLRQLRIAKKLPAAEPIIVAIAGGTYTLREPLVFTPQDSGTTQAPIIYQGDPDAIIEAGKAIGSWKLEKLNGRTVWTTQVDPKWRFEQLWVNDRRATRARAPQEFTFYAAGKATQIEPVKAANFERAKQAFKMPPEALKYLKGLSANELLDATVVAYHSWEISRHRIAKVDFQSGEVLFTGPAKWAFFNWQNRQRFHIENVPAALDKGGEWFLARDGKLSYLPLPGETPQKAKVFAPVIDSFLHFRGNPEKEQFVKEIEFSDLKFRHAGYTLPREGHSDWQAAVTIPAVMMLDGAHHLSFQSCEITNIGTYAIWFRRGCQRNRVLNCWLFDLGAGGIRIGEGEIRRGSEGTGQTAIVNNIIQHGGRLHYGAHGIWIGHSPDNLVRHNDIGGFPYTGISIGWRWGYDESLAKNNTIEWNRIHHLGQGILSDMGAVYTLGPSQGTTISNNVIHDVYAYDYGGWGLYNDEGSTGIMMENNLVYNTKTGGYHQHYGKENVIRNNIFAYSKTDQLQRSRAEEHLSFTFSNNIVLWKEGEVYGRSKQWKDPKFQVESNLYWDERKVEPLFDGKPFKQWQSEGRDKGSLIADPLFVAPAKGDFSLKPDSPVAKIGFKPFDFARAGVYGEAGWINKARKAPMPVLKIAPDAPAPPPVQWKDDFEKTNVNAAPAEVQMYPENKGEEVRITEDAAAAGKRSLKVQDTPGLQNIFNPHFFYSPNHRGGSTTCSFDMRVEAGVTMYHEWRDDAQPYRVGPSFWIKNGQVTVADKPLMELPVGQWARFEVTSKLGAQSSGTWDLSVTITGQPAKKFPALKNGSAEWKTLTWLGFSSMANEKTVFYLDNLEFKNSAAK